MTATIIICTYNRSAFIKQTIVSAATQVLSHGAYEILVIDNNSTDRTASVVAECQAAVGNISIRYVLEPKVGLSHARNRALREARGKVLCFLDDDAVPEPGWLEWIMRGFSSGGPRVMSIGGQIIPVYESARPSWISGRLEQIYRPTMQAQKLYATTFPHYPFGANLAIRADIFEELGGFDPAFGYRGKELIPCEETEFLLRIEKAGYQILMEPRAIVRHVIPDVRFNHRYYLLRRYAGGKGEAMLEIAHFADENCRARWWVIVSKLMIVGALTLALSAFYYMLLAVARRTQHAALFELLCRLAERLGYIRTAWLILLKNPKMKTGWLWPVYYFDPHVRKGAGLNAKRVSFI